MSVVVDVLLALAVLIVLTSSVGILVMPDVYQKLHYVTPISVVAPVLVGVAVLIQVRLVHPVRADLAGTAARRRRQPGPVARHDPRRANPGNGGLARRRVRRRTGRSAARVMTLDLASTSPFVLPGAVMDVLQVVVLVLVAALATGVVLTRAPVRQVIVLSGYGLMLAVLFLAFQAPDVTLSELTVGAVALPVIILLALAKVRGQQQEHDRKQGR